MREQRGGELDRGEDKRHVAQRDGKRGRVRATIILRRNGVPSLPPMPSFYVPSNTH